MEGRRTRQCRDRRIRVQGGERRLQHRNARRPRRHLQDLGLRRPRPEDPQELITMVDTEVERFRYVETPFCGGTKANGRLLPKELSKVKSWPKIIQRT